MISLHSGSRPTDPAAAGTPWLCESLGAVLEAGPLLDDLLAAVKGQGYRAKDLFAIRLAVEEAVVNAIKHGHRDRPKKLVTIRYHVTPEQVLVQIEDEGPGFDPTQVPDPLAPENLERSCGRGVFLMRSYMTWVRYNDRGNCVTLCKHRTPSR